MSQYDVLQRRASVGERSLAVRNTQDFHLYLWPYDGSANLQPSNGAPGIALMDYYGGLGMNFTRDHYDISGPSAYVEATLRSGMDFWAVRTEALRIDLWWVDTESTFYTGLAADAATDLAGAQNAVSWSKSQWATHQATTISVGNYGNSTGIRTQGIIGSPFNTTPLTYSTLQNDNDVNGAAVSAAWDWMGPELYQTKIGDWIAGLDWLCNEKTRMGLTAKLIPFIWRRSATTTYNMMASMLEYAYSRPECNGLVLWGTGTAAVAPDYYDGEEWMQATLDFMAKYNIKRGNPF
jgi:hypothetical protein